MKTYVEMLVRIRVTSLVQSFQVDIWPSRATILVAAAVVVVDHQGQADEVLLALPCNQLHPGSCQVHTKNTIDNIGGMLYLYGCPLID